MTKAKAASQAEEIARAQAIVDEIARTNARIVALERGPGMTEKVLSRTMEGIRLEVIISVFTEMVGQMARQNRNVEQAAAEIAVKSIKCADELIRVLTAANHPPA